MQLERLAVFAQEIYSRGPVTRSTCWLALAILQVLAGCIWMVGKLPERLQNIARKSLRILQVRHSQSFVPVGRYGIVFRIVDPLATVLCILKLLQPLVDLELGLLQLSWDMDYALVQDAQDFTGR